MKGLVERGGSFYGVFRDVTRSPQRKWVPLDAHNREAAEHQLLKLRKQYSLDQFDPWAEKRRGRTHLSEAVKSFLKTRSDHNRYARETYRGYASTLNAFENYTRAVAIDGATEREVERFIRRGKLAVTTQQQYLQRLEAFFNWAIEEGFVRDNPASAVRVRLAKESYKRRAKLQARRDFLMPNDLLRVINAIYTERSTDGRRMSRAAVAMAAELAVSTGLTVSEITSLTMSDVTLREVETADGRRALAGHIRMDRQKTGVQRTIPLVPRAALLISSLRDKQRSEANCPLLVGPRDGKPLQPTTVSSHFKRYIVETGVSGRVTFHSTRHSFISWLLMLGLPVYAVKELAAHSNSKQTEAYAHAAQTYLMGQAREVATDILAFYCPGIDRGILARYVGAAGAGIGGYAFGGSSMLDILFGAYLYREDRTFAVE